MLKNRFTRLVQGFSRKEMTRFYAFAQSPYFNKHEDVRNLVAYFHKIYPRLTEKTVIANGFSKAFFQKHLSNKRIWLWFLPMAFAYWNNF